VRIHLTEMATMARAYPAEFRDDVAAVARKHEAKRHVFAVDVSSSFVSA
jgi:hypothetical protein